MFMRMHEHGGVCRVRGEDGRDKEVEGKRGRGRDNLAIKFRVEVNI